MATTTTTTTRRRGRRGSAREHGSGGLRRTTVCRVNAKGTRRDCFWSTATFVRAHERVAKGAFGLALAASLSVLPVAVESAQAIGPVKVFFTDVVIERTTCDAGQTAGRQVGGNDFRDAKAKDQESNMEFTNGCFTVTARAKNPSKKELFNADVFGRVYDKYGNTTRDDTENIRLSYIDKIPPGESQVQFGFIVNSVFAEEGAKDGGLTIQGLKASGFAGGVMPGQGSGTVGPVDCDEFAQEMGECETLPF